MLEYSSAACTASRARVMPCAVIAMELGLAVVTNGTRTACVRADIAVLRERDDNSMELFFPTRMHPVRFVVVKMLCRIW